MKKIYLILGVVIIVAVIAVVASVYFSNKDSEQVFSNQDIQQVDSKDSQTENGNDVIVTADVLAVHNKADDCWTVISGKVYDITKYVPRHPGGDEVLLACGTDGTSLFTQRQTSDGQDIGSGTPHSNSAVSQLESYLIGDFDSN